MVYRDPNTGQFVSENNGHGQFNDIESWTFNSVFQFDAQDENDFTERSETILDIDQITDRRREEAVLLYADVTVSAAGTGDVTFGDMGYYLQFQTGRTDLDPILRTSEESRSDGTDSLDAIGKPLVYNGRPAQNQLVEPTDWTVDMDKLADPVFHPRNEIMLTGELLNTGGEGEADLTVNVSGQMVFGLRDTEGSGR